MTQRIGVRSPKPEESVFDSPRPCDRQQRREPAQAHVNRILTFPQREHQRRAPSRRASCRAVIRRSTRQTSVTDGAGFTPRLRRRAYVKGFCITGKSWGLGAAGSALPRHGRGRGFDFRRLHGGGCRFESCPGTCEAGTSASTRSGKPALAVPVAQVVRVPHLGW